MIHFSDKASEAERTASKDLTAAEIKKAIDILNQLPLTYSQEQLIQRFIYQFEKLLTSQHKSVS
jgi:hypothetical protein